MWDLFFLAVFVGFLFIYIPGFAVLRAFGISRIACLACAPIVTIVAYSLLPILYEKINVSCSWAALVGPTLAVGLLLHLAFRLAARRCAADSGSGCGRKNAGVQEPLRDWLCFGLYALVGVVVTSCVFMGTFENAGSYVQEFDNVHHLNSIRAFVDSGIWSSLSSTLYPVNITDFPAPFSSGAFYPSAWHCVAALMVNALGVPIAVGANAANFLFVAVVFPTGMFLLLSKLFPENRAAVFFGAFVALAFATFPWKLLAWGPLYPNLAAFSLLPAALSLFISASDAELDRRKRFFAGALFFAALVAFAFTQPNAAFTAGVVLLPLCIQLVARFAGATSFPKGVSRAVRVAVACGLFVAAVAAAWVVLYRAPFMGGVTSYSWPAFADFSQAIANVLFVGSKETLPQTALGVVVLIGFIGALARKECRWIACSYVVLCVLYVTTASFDGPLKQLLTGFWYTDALRLAANMAIVAVPLAALGLYGVYAALRRLLKAAFGRMERHRPAAYAVACVVAIGFAAVNFYPFYPPDEDGSATSAFGAEKNFLHMAYGLGGVKMYGPEEMEFIEEVKSIVPADAVVLNEPNDGTTFAYGIDDLNVYYRYVSSYGGSDESDVSKTVRRSLDVIAFDPSVAKAVEAIGAEYLVKLDLDGRTDGNHFLFSYEEEDWFGIDRVDDDTAGFEVVLSRGDMRLYRIVLPEAS